YRRRHHTASIVRCPAGAGAAAPPTGFGGQPRPPAPRAGIGDRTRNSRCRSPVHRFSGGWFFASRRLGSGISLEAAERACRGLLYSVGDSGAGVAFLLFPLEFAVFLVMLVTLLGDDEQANGGEDVFQHRWLLRGMRGAAAQAFQRLALASPRQPGCPGRGRAYDQVAVSAFGAAGEEVVGREHV